MPASSQDGNPRITWTCSKWQADNLRRDLYLPDALHHEHAVLPSEDAWANALVEKFDQSSRDCVVFTPEERDFIHDPEKKDMLTNTKHDLCYNIRVASYLSTILTVRTLSALTSWLPSGNSATPGSKRISTITFTRSCNTWKKKWA